MHKVALWSSLFSNGRYNFFRSVLKKDSHNLYAANGEFGSAARSRKGLGSVVAQQDAPGDHPSCWRYAGLGVVMAQLGHFEDAMDVFKQVREAASKGAQGQGKGVQTKPRMNGMDGRWLVNVMFGVGEVGRKVVVANSGPVRSFWWPEICETVPLRVSRTERRSEKHVNEACRAAAQSR